MMRKILVSLFLLISGYAMAQPTNYVPYQSRNRWIAGVFDSTFHVPRGATPSLRTGGWNNGGALFYRTSDSSLYVYTGTQWRKLGEGGDSTRFATIYRTDTMAINIRNEILAAGFDTVRVSGILPDTCFGWLGGSVDSYSTNGNCSFPWADSITYSSGAQVVFLVPKDTTYGVAVGTRYPRSYFDISGVDSANRMQFHSDLGAFRSGHLTDSSYSIRKVGIYSVGMGYRPLAIGEKSISLGESNESRANNSVSIGTGNKNYGTSSVLIGSGNSTIDPLDSAEVGFISFAIGENNNSSQDVSVAVGFQNHSTGPGSGTWGWYNRATNYFSNAFGHAIAVNGYGSFGFGIYGSDYTDPVDTIQQDSTLAIMGGIVGIRTVTPDSSLTVKGGVHFQGGVRLPNLPNGGASADSVLVAAADGTVKKRNASSFSSITIDTTTVPIATFTVGAGFAADTSIVTDSSLFGSFFTGQYEYTIKQVQAVIKGNSGDSIVLKIVYNDTFNLDGTKISNGNFSLNNRFTGNQFTVTSNRTVPVNSWIWMKPEAVINGKKPKYISVTLLGYKTYIAP